MTKKWIFEKKSPNGGGSGEAFHSHMNAPSGILPAELVIRESIQNSVDASDKTGNTVDVRIRVKNLSEQCGADFVKALRLCLSWSWSLYTSFTEANPHLSRGGTVTVDTGQLPFLFGR